MEDGRDRPQHLQQHGSLRKPTRKEDGARCSLCREPFAGRPRLGKPSADTLPSSASAHPGLFARTTVRLHRRGAGRLAKASSSPAVESGRRSQRFELEAMSLVKISFGEEFAPTSSTRPAPAWSTSTLDMSFLDSLPFEPPAPPSSWRPGRRECWCPFRSTFRQGFGLEMLSAGDGYCVPQYKNQRDAGSRTRNQDCSKRATGV